MQLYQYCHERLPYGPFVRNCATARTPRSGVWVLIGRGTNLSPLMFSFEDAQEKHMKIVRRCACLYPSQAFKLGGVHVFGDHNRQVVFVLKGVWSIAVWRKRHHQKPYECYPPIENSMDRREVSLRQCLSYNRILLCTSRQRNSTINQGRLNYNNTF